MIIPDAVVEVVARMRAVSLIDPFFDLSLVAEGHHMTIGGRLLDGHVVTIEDRVVTFDGHVVTFGVVGRLPLREDRTGWSRVATANNNPGRLRSRIVTANGNPDHRGRVPES